MTSSTLTGLACVRCGNATSGNEKALGCQRCLSEGTPAALSTTYDLEAARATFTIATLRKRSFGPARYAELMPPGVGMFGLAEGATPLLQAEELARRIGVRSILVKDESRNPTWSFKDRAAAIAAARAVEDEAKGLVVSSTGNAAAATSAYGAAADLPVVVLFARGVDVIMAAFVRAFGGNIVATASKIERWVYMRHCVDEFEFYPNSNYADPPVGTDPYALDGYKAIAFEVWDQLGGRTPTGIVSAVGYGDSLFAMFKAFSELETLGLGDVPTFVVGERYGSLSQTMQGTGDELVKVEIDGPTVSSSIATAQSTFQALHALRESTGAVYQVSDDEVLAAQQLLIDAEGLFVEASSAAGIAALIREIESGNAERDGEYVFINTSAGIKSVSAMGLLDQEPEVVEDRADFDRFMARILAEDRGGTT